MEHIYQLLLPGLAGCSAVCISHPLDLIKTRLQLDNELSSKNTPKKYRGWVHCATETYKRNGIRGLQSGLQMGILREFFFNAARIGFYSPILNTIKTDATPTSTENFAAGFLCGATAALIVNPIEVMKVRMQALGGLTGHQHQHKTLFAACRSLVRDEGLQGFYRGVGMSTIRGILGPGTQISVYHRIRTMIEEAGLDPTDIRYNALNSAFSAGASIIACNPADVLRTRLYNQPIDAKGNPVLYKNGADAFLKILRTEGVFALYKGAWSHYMRLGPHLVLVFFFLEQYKSLQMRLLPTKCDS